MNPFASTTARQAQGRGTSGRQLLLQLFKDELSHLRGLVDEFAREHPKIAGRLGLHSIEVADPHVERLLEGFAYMAARVRAQLDAEHPGLIGHLLQAMYPNFLAPLPSMMVVSLDVDTRNPNLQQGLSVPRHTAVHALVSRGRDTFCQFRTSTAVTLWPIRLTQVQYVNHAADLGLAQLPVGGAIQGGLRIRLCAGGGVPLSQLGLDRLAFYISAPGDVAMRLHELVLAASLGSLVCCPGANSQTSLSTRWRDATSIRPLGYADDEALLPESPRMFSGHRLLQEVAVLPQRLLFFEVGDLRSRLATLPGNEAELVLLFGRGDADLQNRVNGDSLALHCTPAINLFHQRLKPVLLDREAAEHHLVPDPTRTQDFEVHSVDSVKGLGPAGERVFEPLYGGRMADGADAIGHYTTRRRPRTLTPQQAQQGLRAPGYLGEEVFLALQDGPHGPVRQGLRQLSVNAWVTNRDLPLLLPAVAGAPAWRIEASNAITAVRCLSGPTHPVSRLASGHRGWDLVSQLRQNHSAMGPDAQANASLLRDMLQLWGPPDDAAWLRQSEGLRSVAAQLTSRRLALPGPLCFAQGMALTLTVDESAFQGASAFLLASAIECGLARHAAVNSFSQLSLHSLQRGEIHRWPARSGLGPLL